MLMVIADAYATVVLLGPFTAYLANGDDITSSSSSDRRATPLRFCSGCPCYRMIILHRGHPPRARGDLIVSVRHDISSIGVRTPVCARRGGGGRCMFDAIYDYGRAVRFRPTTCCWRGKPYISYGRKRLPIVSTPNTNGICNTQVGLLQMGGGIGIRILEFLDQRCLCLERKCRNGNIARCRRNWVMRISLN